jgi:hypothetical protein
MGVYELTNVALCEELQRFVNFKQVGSFAKETLQNLPSRLAGVSLL